jgi:hypothetical protein
MLGAGPDARRGLRFGFGFGFGFGPSGGLDSAFGGGFRIGDGDVGVSNEVEPLFLSSSRPNSIASH